MADDTRVGSVSAKALRKSPTPDTRSGSVFTQTLRETPDPDTRSGSVFIQVLRRRQQRFTSIVLTETDVALPAAVTQTDDSEVIIPSQLAEELSEAFPGIVYVSELRVGSVAEETDSALPASVVQDAPPLVSTNPWARGLPGPLLVLPSLVWDDRIGAFVIPAVPGQRWWSGSGSTTEPGEGGSVRVWNGSALVTATVKGVWTGSAIAPVTVKGVWNGSTILPVTGGA